MGMHDQIPCACLHETLSPSNRPESLNREKLSRTLSYRSAWPLCGWNFGRVKARHDVGNFVNISAANF
jgi:hypothetical protein